MRSTWDILAGRRTQRARRILIVATAAVLLAPVVVALTVRTTPAVRDVASARLPDADAAPPAGVPTAWPADAVLPAERGVAEVPTATPLAAGSSPALAPPRPSPTSADAAPEPVTPVGEPPKRDDVPGQWIVQLRDGEDASAVAADHAAHDDADVTQVYDTAVVGYSAGMSDQDAARVADDPRVESVIRDRMVHATDDILPTGIPRSDAVDMATAVGGGGDVDADVAVVDTGIDLNYGAELNTRSGKNCISSSKAPQDGDGHGTHVAGTIGARDNGSGVVGVAPGVRLWAVKVLDDSGNGTWSQVICGLDWVQQNANTIDVANMSLGGPGGDSSCGGNDPLHNAICGVVNAGVPVVVAAGNESDNASHHVPAAYDQVVTVSALADFDGKPGGLGNATCRTDQDDTLADFSNYGPDVDIIAPGVCILSTWKGGGTKTLSGTSMATPHVTGAFADWFAGHPDDTVSQARDAVLGHGNDGWSGDKGDGGQEPLLDLSFLGGTGLPSSGGGTGGSITAAGTPGTYDSGTKSKVKLTWSGAAGTNVDIWRNSTSGGALSLIKTTANDGADTDKLGTKLSSGTTRTYRVCAAGSTTTCSSDVLVTF
jgi:subtilisin family serine protease